MQSQIDLDNFALAVKRPGRYADNEINAYHKKPIEETTNFVLAFPDLYEIGMSHLGLKILYKILNETKIASADRVYAPDIDLAEYLKKYNTPLFSIENKIPISSFDVLGFTLQYELSYTNILLILDLSNIPVLAKERTEEDPLIIAGGPGAFNPQPLAPFIDAFVIGDGEDIIVEIADTLNDFDNLSRGEKLKKLSVINGVYTPKFYSEISNEKGTYVKPDAEFVSKKISKNFFSDFDNTSKLPHPQLVPITDIVHNRATIEIMRGCTRGCRFCQAGMIYRPIRERDEKLVLDLINTEMELNGWDEISLVSLSSSDYTCITSLIDKLTNSLEETNTNLSLPSLRIDSFENNISNSTKKILGKTITLAPEAGSQRLRNIINKNISEQEITLSVQKALELGIRNLKLYFMIGLPFETDTDIKKIVELVQNMVKLSSGKHIRITVKLAPFIPKAFTPFQWTAQDDQDIILGKIFYIKDNLSRHKNVRVKYHDPKISCLEAVIARGDSKISSLIHSAYKKGAIFSSWDEHFNFDIWKESAQENDIDMNKYTGNRDTAKKLPWEHIDIGVNKEFLLQELKKAEREKVTADCREGNCSRCGMSERILHKFVTTSEDYEINKDRSAKITQSELDNHQIYKYRAFYEKNSPLKYSSHRDVMKILYQIIRKSGLPIYYTKGYNKHPKLSFCSPLALGMTGKNEFFDLRLVKKMNTAEILRSLNINNPRGLKIKKVAGSSKSLPKIGSFKNELIKIYGNAQTNLQQRITDFSSDDSFVGKKEKKIFMNDVIENIDYQNNSVIVEKSIIGAGIIDILKNFYDFNYKELSSLKIERLGLK